MTLGIVLQPKATVEFIWKIKMKGCISQVVVDIQSTLGKSLCVVGSISFEISCWGDEKILEPGSSDHCTAEGEGLVLPLSL